MESHNQRRTFDPVTRLQKIFYSSGTIAFLITFFVFNYAPNYLEISLVLAVAAELALFIAVRRERLRKQSPEQRSNR
jgi:hypothetical protein